MFFNPQIRTQRVEYYTDAAQLRDVADLGKMIQERIETLQLPATTVSHNNPSNSIYVHAVVVYG